jgi:hypothetical protein
MKGSNCNGSVQVDGPAGALFKEDCLNERDGFSHSFPGKNIGWISQKPKG